MSFNSSGDILVKGMKSLAASAAVAVTTITSLSVVVGAYAKEIKIASDISGVAVERLQLMAHATTSVGIGTEKLGEIFKDTREKIGDFLNTGGGGFQDFVDAMKLTKEEARLVAVEFSHLSGDEILQEMVSRMQEAEVSTVQMSHALEGVASDTTNLIPLLLDAGKGMNTLSDAMGEVSLPLTDDDVDLFIRMGASTKIASKALQSLGEQVLLDLGEAFIEAADKAAHFYASLNEGTQAQKSSRLVEIVDEIADLNQAITNNETAGGRLQNVLQFNSTSAAGDIQAQKDINALLDERMKIQGELAEMRGLTPDTPDEVDPVQVKKDEALAKVNPNADEKKKALDDLRDSFKSEQVLLEEKYNQERILAQDDKALMLEIEAKYIEDLAALNEDNSLQAISDRFKSEQELLIEKYETELEIIGENNELKLQLEDEFLQAMVDLDFAAEEEKQKNKEKADKKKLKSDDSRHKMEQSLESKNVSSLMAISSSLVGHNTAIGKAMFIASKAVALSEAFVNTQVATTKALTIDPTGILAAKVQLSGNLAMAAIAASAIGGLSGGGSSGASGGGSDFTSNNQSTPSADFEQETTGLGFSDSTAEGSTVSTIRFATDSGDDLIDAIAKAMNDGKREGRF